MPSLLNYDLSIEDMDERDFEVYGNSHRPFFPLSQDRQIDRCLFRSGQSPHRVLPTAFQLSPVKPITRKLLTYLPVLGQY